MRPGTLLEQKEHRPCRANILFSEVFMKKYCVDIAAPVGGGGGAFDS